MFSFDLKKKRKIQHEERQEKIQNEGASTTATATTTFYYWGLLRMLGSVVASIGYGRFVPTKNAPSLSLCFSRGYDGGGYQTPTLFPVTRCYLRYGDRFHTRIIRSILGRTLLIVTVLVADGEKHHQNTIV